MIDITRRTMLAGLVGGTAVSFAMVGGCSGGGSSARKLAAPKNEDFYKADGSFDQEAAKKAYYEMMEYYHYPITARLRGEDFWTLDFNLGIFSEVGMAGIFWINRLEDDATVNTFVHDWDLTFPVLMDRRAEGHQTYTFDGCSDPFPRNVIVDQDGVIAYLNCEYDRHAMSAVVHDLLGVDDHGSGGDGTGDNSCEGGLYNGEIEENGVANDGTLINRVLLAQNSPNPFGGFTSIRYGMPVSEPVRLEIFNGTGRKVRTLIDAVIPAGDHTATWDGTDDAGRTIASGVYFYRLRVGDTVISKRMILRH